MKEVKAFIDAFITDEFNCNKANYDFGIPDQQYEKLRLKTAAYFHPVNGKAYWRGLEEEDVKELDDSMRLLYAQNADKAVPRSLFQIKHYKNPELGAGLAKWVQSEDLYACYTSYTENTGRPLGYNKLFYVANTSEGLKIIYELTYGVKEPGWLHSHDLAINRVEAPGILFSSEKYMAPGEETSLADYNRV